MEIAYTVTKDDLYNFNLYHYNNCPIRQRYYKIIKYIVPLIYFGTIVSNSTDNTDKLYLWLYWGIQLTFFAILTSLWFLFLKYSVKWELKYIVKKTYSETKDRQTLGLQKLIIDEDGVIEKNEFGESKTSWFAINKITENESLILIYFGTDRAYIIPKRAFDSKTKVNEFVQQAKLYYKG